MPPKAPSAPGRGGRRPRRGGAAGETTTTRATEASDTPMQDAGPAVVESTESSASSTATPAASVGAAPTAQMTAPDTATPAATAATAPKAPTRTNSLRRTAAASATPGPSTRGAKKAVVPAPRAVRRSKEERETLEKAEQKKRSDEARAALREQRRAGRGRGEFKSDRGRGGKARGGFMGDRERGIREQVASGPFSAGQVSAEGSYRSRAGGGGGGGGGYGGGGGGGGGARIKSEGGTYGSIHSIKAEDGGYISSDEDAGEEGPRQDVDVIDISDDDDHGGKRGMVPIRVSRVAHKEREKPVSTEVKTKDAAAAAGASSIGRRTPSPTAVRKGKQRVKDVLVTGTQRRWKGAWSDSEDSEPEIQIKPEPTDDSTEITAQPMETDDVHIKESSSPDTRRKSGKSRARLHGLPTEAPPQQTKEEQREWERHHMDLELIREELGQLAMPPPPKPKQPTTTGEDGTAAADAEGDTNMTDSVDAADVRRQQQQGEGVEQGEDQQPAIEDRRADRVYLFQFPPILPDLLVSSNPTSASATAKKEAPPSPELSRRTKPNLDGSNNTQSDPVNLDDIPDISTTTASAAAASNTKATPVKVEGGTGANIPASAGQSTLHSNVPSGFVGRLRVHASGRTTLDWGGTAMQVGMGTDVQFLQDVVVSRFFEPRDDDDDGLGAIAAGPPGAGNRRAKKEDKDEDADRGPGGEVMGLGQVRGKFVVTPDWEEIVGQRI